MAAKWGAYCVRDRRLARKVCITVPVPFTGVHAFLHAGCHQFGNFRQIGVFNSQTFIFILQMAVLRRETTKKELIQGKRDKNSALARIHFQ